MKSRIDRIVLALFCLCLLSVAASAGEDGKQAFSLVNVDHPRVIALSAPVAEILFGIGRQDVLVGRTRWTSFPPGVKDIPSVGDASTPDLELIIALKPHVVLADAHFAALKTRLEDQGIPLILMDAYTRDGARRAALDIGALLGSEAAAAAFVEQTFDLPRHVLAERLADLLQTDRPRGLIVAGAGGSMFSFSKASGRTTLEDSGALSLTAHMETPFPVVSKEWIAGRRPDFFLLVPPETGRVRSDHLGSARMEFTVDLGIADKPVIVLDGPLTYGPRAEWGALFLAREIHPARFKDLDVDALYRRFLKDTFHLTEGDLPGDCQVICP